MVKLISLNQHQPLKKLKISIFPSKPLKVETTCSIFSGLFSLDFEHYDVLDQESP